MIETIQPFVPSLIIDVIAAILMLSTSISCLFLVRSVINKNVNPVERNQSIVATITGWCTFVVVLLALGGGSFALLFISATIQ